MKNLAVTFCLFLSVSFVKAQTTYPGNTKSGYGGTVGQGSLTISDDASNFYFTFTKGPGSLNDAVVIYIDALDGGFTTTANFTDEGDGLRKAISGVQGTDRATLNFPSGFKPEFAIAFDQNFGGLWKLAENGEHPFLTSVNLSPTGTATSPTYTFAVAKTDPPFPGFRFLVTYVSETGYRSNEFIGDDGPATNPQNSSYTATNYLIYANPLAIRISDVNAQVINKAVKISWNVADKDAGGSYEIERSANGTAFHNIASMNGTSSQSYTFMDNNPLNGNGYYRIVSIDAQGNKTYSKTVSVSRPSIDALKAYMSGGVLKLSLDLQQEGNYKIALINASGQALLMRDLNYTESITNYDVSFDHTLTPGIYSVLIRGKDTNLSTQILVR